MWGCGVAWLYGLLLAVPPELPADTAYLIGKEPVTGRFAGYEKGFFLLDGGDGKTFRIADKRVQRLAIEQPPGMVLSLTGTHQEPQVLVRGYELPLLEVERDGRTERHNLNRVNWIRKPSEVGWAEGFKETGTVISRGEAVDIASFARTGRVTAVHFHRPDSPDSVKMQAYLSRVYHMDRAGIEYLRVEPGSPDAPVLSENRVARIPEIWIYDRNGRLLCKLTPAATPRDVDDALERGQHAGQE